MKTNGARALDALGIAYELRHYEVDPDDLSAVTVASKISMPVEQVFKTLVCVTDSGEHLFAIVPGADELDPKKLAAAAWARRVELAPLKEVQPLTGYIRGGVTVFGAKKHFPVYADETIELFDSISVSAGVRGTQLILVPADYLRAVRAGGPVTVADLTRVPSRGGARETRLL
jgi:Cys-tRNA(Pro)/Cys-tRNA(Cys) deacylase